MNPGKAIEILEIARVDRKTCDTTEFFDAAKLGIEAIRRLTILRKYPRQSPKWLLPGETDD